MNTSVFFKLLNEYYWKTLQLPQRREQIFENTVNALLHFTGYLYERRGGTVYAEVAREAIQSNRKLLEIRTQWRRDTQERVFSDFVHLCEKYGYKQNPTHDPLKPVHRLEQSRKRSLLEVASPHRLQNKSLAAWASGLVRSNDIKAAFDTLAEIRGVGPKIASFYLRDIAVLSQVNEVAGEQSYLLQPIDIWTSRAASRLNPAASKMTPKAKAETLIEFEQNNALEIGQANIGFWVLGSQFAGDPESFAKAVDVIRDGRGMWFLFHLISREVELAKERLGVLEGLLGTVE
jgi:endonuclease III